MLTGPVDVERQCGVILPNGQPCARSLTCKSHSMGAKRAVAGRSLPYDMLLAAYQKKNQARQQSEFARRSSTKSDIDNCIQRLLSMPTLRSRKTTTPMLAPSTVMKRQRLSWPPSPNGTHSLLWPSRCSIPFGVNTKSTGCNNSWQPPRTMGARTFSKSVATGLNACHRAIPATAPQFLSCRC